VSLGNPRGQIILDRDGVLNEIVVDPEHGTIDSPMNPEQAKVFEFIPKALKRLNDLGFLLAVASNQPAAAKGKTTKTNLEKTHQLILERATAMGAVISSSHICFHKKEDNCDCRKPKPALLKEAIAAAKDRLLLDAPVWMVGDGVTDVQAGKALDLKTAFLGPKKCDACKVMESNGLQPDFWGEDLRSFVSLLEKEYSNSTFVKSKSLKEES
jgi:histidinol-phosphate phosphatase family protein